MPKERESKRERKRDQGRLRVREGEGCLVRHEVRQSNVPPTCENLFMHEKAGKERARE